MEPCHALLSFTFHISYSKIPKKEAKNGENCLFRGIDREIADEMFFAIKALNREGQEKALAYIEDLTRIPEYRKPQEDFEELHTYLQKETQDAMRGNKE